MKKKRSCPCKNRRIEKGKRKARRASERNNGLRTRLSYSSVDKRKLHDNGSRRSS